MNAEEEERAVDQVIDRLAKRFPDVPRERVAAIVGEEHLVLQGNPIRDFVPVLVEHEARDRLRSEGATPVLTEDAAAALDGGVGPRLAEPPYDAPVRLLNADLGGGSGGGGS